MVEDDAKRKAEDARQRLVGRATTDGLPPRPGFEDKGVPAPARPDGQHEAYYILSEEERAKGFVRPVRNSYIHTKCGVVTRMGQAIAETYARNPQFYGSTFCVGCHAHFPVGAEGEFVWDGTQDKVGT
jgi:hypothetical protein